jgi:hypothetical protein
VDVAREAVRSSGVPLGALFHGVEDVGGVEPIAEPVRDAEDQP